MKSIICVGLAACVIVAISATPGVPAATAQPAAAGANTVTLDHCLVQLNEVDGEAYVPAQEAGVLIKFNVRDGQQVNEHDLLANIDDAQARKQKKNAEAEYNAANETASSEVDIQAAEKAAKVTEYEYRMDQKANKEHPGTVTDVEMQQKQFQWEKMVLAIEQAKKKKVVDGFTAVAKQAEMELGQIAIERREIRAPFEGVVQEIKQHLGEWVKPGDPVIRLIHLDRLRVEGFLSGETYNPIDVTDRAVSVQVMLAGGRSMQFPGKIVFVASEVGGDGRYKVRAEVDNRKENGQWVLRPGMSANMTIQLK